MTLPLRYAPEQPYWHQREGDKVKSEIYAGPAMLAPVTDAQGEITGCHITWLDPSRPGKKLELPNPDKPDEMLDPRKLRGTRNKGAIRLITPKGFTRLVIGEGIETVLSVYEAERASMLAASTAYWSAIALGFLGGKARDSIPHPTLKTPAGRPKRIGGPWPELQPEKDLDLPDQVTQVVLLGDSDSEPVDTEMKLRRAAARWDVPGRTIKVAWPPAGADFNDVLQNDGPERVKALIAGAKPFGPLSIDLPSDRPKARRRRHAALDDWSGGGSVPPLGAEPPGPVDPGGAVPPDAVRRCWWEPENDVGNAKRLIAHFGDDILFVRGIGWHSWTGTHWEKEGADESLERFAQITAERIALEKPLTNEEQKLFEQAAHALEKDPEKRTAEDASAIEQRAKVLEDLNRKGNPKGRWSRRAGYAVTSGNGGKLESMIKRAIPHKARATSEADQDPLAFNVLNGTLRFFQEPDPECPDPDVTRLKWSVRLDPHRRDDLMTKLAPVIYDADATCPEWDKFLARVQPKPQMRAFLRDWYGYSMTALTGAQAFVYHQGGGANGKSTFLECIFRILGPYGASLNPESFTGHQSRRGDQATPDMAKLPGVRALRVSELPERVQLQDNLIKVVTGGEPIDARKLNQPFFTFRPVFKASMSGNSKPNITDISEGMWRRLFLVPWTEFIPPEERRELEEMQKLFEPEWSGILNWLLAGGVSYLDTRKLIAPEDVAAATAEHREDMDPVGQFLEACVLRVPGSHVPGGVLYEHYVGWCYDSGLTPLRMASFGRHVPKHGWIKNKGSTINYLDMKMSPSAPARRAPSTSYGVS